MLQASFEEFLIFLQNHVILAALMIDLYHVTLKNIKMKEKTDLLLVFSIYGSLSCNLSK